MENNIQFKVLTITEENNELIQKLAKQKGIRWRFLSNKDWIQKDALAIIVGLGQQNKMEFLSSTNPLEQMKLFMSYKLPEYSIDGVVKMLSELKDITENVEWIEFDIVNNGFIIDHHNGMWSWWNWAAALSVNNKNYQFGGWLWEYEDKHKDPIWSCLHMGIDKSGWRTPAAQDWVKTLTPTKIRFYKGK